MAQKVGRREFYPPVPPPSNHCYYEYWKKIIKHTERNLNTRITKKKIDKVPDEKFQSLYEKVFLYIQPKLVYLEFVQ